MQNSPYRVGFSNKVVNEMMTRDLPCVLLSVHANPQLEHVRGALITLGTGIMFLQLQQL